METLFDIRNYFRSWGLKFFWPLVLNGKIRGSFLWIVNKLKFDSVFVILQFKDNFSRSFELFPQSFYQASLNLQNSSEMLCPSLAGSDSFSSPLFFFVSLALSPFTSVCSTCRESRWGGKRGIRRRFTAWITIFRLESWPLFLTVWWRHSFRHNQAFVLLTKTETSSSSDVVSHRTDTLQHEQEHKRRPELQRMKCIFQNLRLWRWCFYVIQQNLCCASRLWQKTFFWMYLQTLLYPGASWGSTERRASYEDLRQHWQ